MAHRRSNDFEGKHMSDDEIPLGVDMEAVRQELINNARMFEAIGRFIFQFSQLEFTMKAFLSAQIGLAEKYFDAVTAPYDFRILCTVTQTVALMRFPDRKKNIEIIFKRCSRLNDDRNRVAHGLWSNGISGGMTARHVARTSLKAIHHFEKPEDVGKLADMAQTLMSEFLFGLGAPPDAKTDTPT
jgi:hypothetical protein